MFCTLFCIRLFGALGYVGKSTESSKNVSPWRNTMHLLLLYNIRAHCKLNIDLTKEQIFSCVFFHTFCLRTLIILLININNQSLNNTYTRAHTMLNVFEVVHNWRMLYKVRCVLFPFIAYILQKCWICDLIEFTEKKKETNGEWMKYHSASCKHIKCAWNISWKFLDSRNFWFVFMCLNRFS